MNVFNRIIIILLILAAMLILPLVLILPEQAELALRYAADIIHANLVWLNTLTPAAYMGMRALLAGAGLVVFMIGLLFLALEVIRIRRKTVRLRDGSGELMMDGIAGHLAYYIDLLADVLRVKPKVVSKGKSVQVELYVETAPGVNIPAKSAEIRDTARQVVEEELGLQLKGEVKVVIKPVSYPQKRRKTRRPAAPRAIEKPLPVEQETFEDFTPPAQPQTERQVVKVKESTLE